MRVDSKQLGFSKVIRVQMDLLASLAALIKHRVKDDIVGRVGRLNT